MVDSFARKLDEGLDKHRENESLADVCVHRCTDMEVDVFVFFLFFVLGFLF